MREDPEDQNMIEYDRSDFDPRWPCHGNQLILGEIAKSVAARFSVIPAIHKRDYIFLTSFIHFKGDIDAAADGYYTSGRATAENLRNIMCCLGYDYSFGSIRAKPFTLLDFAAGYGCATRHLRNVMPSASIHSIDIHPEAVAFNQDVLGCPSSVSRVDPADLEPVDTFDVVLALSFFSHIAKARFAPWLRCLLAHTKVGGNLIFTTAGEESRRISMSHVQVDEDGFGAIRESEQYDLPLNDYQHVVALPRFVHARLAELPQAELKAFIRSFWWQHQDTYVVGRRA